MAQGFSRKEAFRFQKPILVLGQKGHYFAWVDLDDWLWAKRVRWVPHRWFKDADVVARGVLNGARVYLHREIAARAHGPAPSAEHVAEFLNGDRLDCRRDNLAWAHKDKTVWKLKKCVETADRMKALEGTGVGLAAARRGR